MDDPVWLAATAALLAALLAIARIDLRQYRIPDGLSLPLMAAGLGLAALRPGLVGLPLSDHAIGAAAGFGVLAAIGAWYHRRTGIDGLGLGDAKLFGAAGAWLGWQMLPHVLLAASLAGLVAAGLLRRRRIAFGPWIAAGFFGVWLWRTYLP